MVNYGLKLLLPKTKVLQCENLAKWCGFGTGSLDVFFIFSLSTGHRILAIRKSSCDCFYNW